MADGLAKSKRSATTQSPMRRLGYLVGQTAPAMVQAHVARLGGGTVCIENYSMDDLKSQDNIRHISDFGPEPGDASARQRARALVAALSDTPLSTGIAVKDSFQYRGISAWWFLEIAFQEPYYLHTRRQQALHKAAKVLKTKPAVNLGAIEYNYLPIVPAARKAEAPPDVRGWLGTKKRALIEKGREFAAHSVRTWLQRRYLSRLGQCDVLSIIEHENLRRHTTIHGTVSAVLPYAEGVIELLHAKLGKRLSVVTKSRPNAAYEGWEFLGPPLPPLVYKPLPPAFDKALQEVHHLASASLEGHLSLSTLREILVVRLAEYDLYLAMLDRTNAKAIFAYNWEGVFRPLTAAARSKNVKVVGVQQALGPYLHALDHSEAGYYSAEKPGGFATPDILATWGDFHRRAMLSYDYPPRSVVTTGYARLDKHFAVSGNGSARSSACQVLGLDPDRRYMLFTGQARVLDTALLRDDNFKTTLQTLTDLAAEYGFRIIMKPWTSDELSLVEAAAGAYPRLISIAPQNLAVGNADLMSVADWVVGTFSSILGEATLVGAACVLLNYPETRYYFDLPHVELYRDMMPFVDRPEDLEAVMRLILDEENVREAQVARARSAMTDLFGPCDGQAAQRIADLVLREAGAYG